MVKKIRKFGNGIERFLHGEKGQRFFNFAYSIGAAIVIWGALFKILHLPGGSTLLCIGMGTEIFMFILTAFDRPPREYAWEEVFPVFDTHNQEDRPNISGAAGSVVINGGVAQAVDDPYSDQYDEQSGEAYGTYPEEAASQHQGAYAPVAVGPNASIAGLPAGAVLTEEDTNSLRDSISKMAAASEQLSQMAELTTATQDYLAGLAGIASQMQQLQETTRALNEVSGTLLQAYRQITDNSDSIAANAEGYVGSMEDLNRNIGGLNTIYEIQLKSVSSQIETIDRVNRGLKDIRDMYEKSAAESSHYCEETEKMARYMKQLNNVYEQMIKAMTINMYNPMMGGAAAGSNPYVRPDQED
ncbi:MAG: gliding motility protein GldL [Clostridium sp.]|nr:gliding motility protein GldL [Prevotella sp.]MCM1429571.1 gliding motility protein GldL [Clostridium sp.]MCM1476022.1 gliding motility protein GldL [Muribaculaceae bacterium]